MAKDLLNVPGIGVVTDEMLRGVNMFESNKPFITQEVKHIGCTNYTPCPICNKCMIKAAHLYETCNRCKVPFCAHNADARYKMIKPRNFTIDTQEHLHKLLIESILRVVTEYEESKI